MAKQQGYQRIKVPATEHRSESWLAYLDGLLAALDLLYLSLGQGDPLPNGLQLAATQFYSLGDPAKQGKYRDWGLLQVV